MKKRLREAPFFTKLAVVLAVAAAAIFIYRLVSAVADYEAVKDAARIRGRRLAAVFQQAGSDMARKLQEQQAAAATLASILDYRQKAQLSDHSDDVLRYYADALPQRYLGAGFIIKSVNGGDKRSYLFRNSGPFENLLQDEEWRSFLHAIKYDDAQADETKPVWGLVAHAPFRSRENVTAMFRMPVDLGQGRKGVIITEANLLWLRRLLIMLRNYTGGAPICIAPDGSLCCLERDELVFYPHDAMPAAYSRTVAKAVRLDAARKIAADRQPGVEQFHDALLTMSLVDSGWLLALRWQDDLPLPPLGLTLPAVLSVLALAALLASFFLAKNRRNFSSDIAYLEELVQSSGAGSESGEKTGQKRKKPRQRLGKKATPSSSAFSPGA